VSWALRPACTQRFVLLSGAEKTHCDTRMWPFGASLLNDAAGLCLHAMHDAMVSCTIMAMNLMTLSTMMHPLPWPLPRKITCISQHLVAEIEMHGDWQHHRCCIASLLAGGPPSGRAATDRPQRATTHTIASACKTKEFSDQTNMLVHTCHTRHCRGRPHARLRCPVEKSTTGSRAATTIISTGCSILRHVHG
jgi:hypothetical protein